jgi:hypothetical protein
MCCFSSAHGSAPVYVAGTRIFARREAGLQALVYSMTVSLESETAMILPLPVGPGSGEDAVRFVSLETCTAFFDLLEQAVSPLGDGESADGPDGAELAVHSVGCFEASYVPHLSAFSRVDPRFRLSPDVFRRLPMYEDYGFAVFKLAAGARQRIHPMALWFPTRDPARLFFPTVHVHDGELHDTALFDHALYYQRDLPEVTALNAEKPPPFKEDPRWSWDERVAAMKRQGRIHNKWWDRVVNFRNAFRHTYSPDTADWSAELVARTQHMVKPDWRICRHTLFGERPNEDTWIADAGDIDR